MNYSPQRPLTQIQLIVMIGLAASGFMLFSSVYDWASKIEQKELACVNNDSTLQKANETKFIVMMTLASAALIGGIIGVLMVKDHNWVFGPISLIVAAIIGFIYSFGLKLTGNSKAKFWTSLTIFLLFLLLAIGVGKGKLGSKLL